VTRNGRVSVPDVATDRPHLLGAAAVAVVALSAGLASAYGLRDGCASTPELDGVQRSAAGASAPPSQPAIAAPQPAIAAPQHTPQPTPAAPQPTPAAPQPATAAKAAPTALPAPEATPTLEPVAAQPQASQPAALEAAAAARFDRGYVAYLRCDGVPQVAGPFPCPRDLVLERRVWRALSALEHCPLAPEQRGAADIRIEFTRARGRGEWLVASGALDRDAVSRCVGSELAGVGTSLHPTRMIVSFRFALH
jgi:hypothetical protein